LWPEDYIDWARADKSQLTTFLGTFLVRLAKGSLVQEAVPDMVDEAVRITFATVDSWRRYNGLIADAAQFRRLIFAMGAVEAIRLFLQHEYVAARLQRLPPDQQLAVLLRYVVRLAPGDAAPVLAQSFEQASRALREGLDALGDLL
jgi:DNA-directed RNA polymerase specialized sigma24 family protein